MGRKVRCFVCEKHTSFVWKLFLFLAPHSRYRMVASDLRIISDAVECLKVPIRSPDEVFLRITEAMTTKLLHLYLIDESSVHFQEIFLGVTADPPRLRGKLPHFCCTKWHSMRLKHL